MHPPFWRTIQLQNFRSLHKLADFLELDHTVREPLLHLPPFPLNLPLRLAKKIAKNRPEDPIFRQFIPVKDELTVQEGFVDDPVGDGCFRKGPKLIRKYASRALLTVSSACAMHCRYCFRQNFPYETKQKEFTEELKALRNDPSISEVILSGGDPLSLGNEELRSLLSELGNIDSIKRIRFHTRFPIGIPERIDEGFLSLMQEIPKQIYFVVHINHLAELDQEILNAFKAVSRLGIPLLSQTVLLRGVNDSVTVLEELFSFLVDHGIIPYYLHHLDPVTGSARFAVSEEEGKALIRSLTERLSGYAVPKYVREIPGRLSKTSLFES